MWVGWACVLCALLTWRGEPPEWKGAAAWGQKGERMACSLDGEGGGSQGRELEVAPLWARAGRLPRWPGSLGVQDHSQQGR